MNKEGKERKGKKERLLSEAEQRRLEKFEKTTQEMERQGYTLHSLAIGMGKAYVFSVLLLIPLFIIGYGAYYLVHHTAGFFSYGILAFVLIFVVLIVVHELIHGVSWSFFTPHGFKDVEFGIMKPSMSPYCTCLVPLKKGQYIFGTVMPLAVLGIIPMIVSIIIGNPGILLMSILMAGSAAGDIMIIQSVLAYKSSAKEIVYMDHPTEAGCVVFERDNV